MRYTNSDDEAKFLAPKLRTSPAFLQSLKRGEFAAFVRDMTSHAIFIHVTQTDFSQYPKLTSSESAALRRRMREQYGPRPDDSPVPEEAVGSPGEPRGRSARAPPPPDAGLPAQQAPEAGPDRDHAGEPAGDWG